MTFLRYLVSPGDLAAEVAGLAPGSDSRQIMRMFMNTLIWGAVGVIGVALLAI